MGKKSKAKEEEGEKTITEMIRAWDSEIKVTLIY